jgi:integrase
LGKLRVDQIDAARVRDVLAPIWVETPVMARKVRQRIGTVLDYAHVKGWRAAPAPAAPLMKMGLSKQATGGHFAAMPYTDVPAFMAALGDAGVTTGRLALAFTILTAARGGEVRSARWCHIDEGAATWSRPGALMKAGKDHTVTLSEAALALLGRARPLSGGRSDGLIFPGKGGAPMSDMTLGKALKTAGYGQYTVHGFRSSFRDWAAETMPTIPAAVVEVALSHAVGTKVEQAYLRSDFMDMRRKLSEAWADYCSGATNVVHLVGRAA